MPRTTEPVRSDSGGVHIMLTQGKVAVIDEADWPIVEGHSWYAVKNKSGLWYAQTKIGSGRGNQKPVYMHRMLMGNPPPSVLIDHRRGNGLDNRRENLRLTDRVGNARNCASHGGLSQHKGITLRKDSGRWHAKIKYDGRTRHIGYFATELEAAAAYNARAVEVFGEYARLNDLSGGLGSDGFMSRIGSPPTAGSIPAPAFHK